LTFSASDALGRFNEEGGNFSLGTLPPLASSRKPMELGPKVGRSHQVLRGDLNGAMNRLRTTLKTNNVREDSILQKFHERRGMKRKRMRRERFRKRFKEGFKRMVSIVMEMKRQGL